MSMNRFFSLGDGIDTLTGEHKGRGVLRETELQDKIIINELDKEKKIAIENKQTSSLHSEPKKIRSEIDKEINDAKYEIFVVTNYTELYKALGLKGSLTATAPAGISVSSESELFRTVTLTQQTVSLVIRGRIITKVDKISADAVHGVDPKIVKVLEENPNRFVESHGTGYISEVRYGKKIYAIINYENISKQEVMEIKQGLESKLATKNEVNANITSDSKGIDKHAVSDIKIEYTGVKQDVGLPKVASNIIQLCKFIDNFNEAPSTEAPIEYSSQSYATLILDSPAAARLSKQLSIVQPLLAECDKIYNRIRFLIPTIEPLVKGAKHFVSVSNFDSKDMEGYKDKVDRLSVLLDNANYIQRTLEKIVQTIYFYKTDLTQLPTNIAGIQIDSLKVKNSDDYIPPRQLNSQEEEEKYYLKQFAIYDDLNRTIRFFLEQISNMESDIDIISRQLVAEISRISLEDNHFYLVLPPSGATIRWTIKPLKKIINANAHMKFTRNEVKIDEEKKTLLSTLGEESKVSLMERVWNKLVSIYNLRKLIIKEKHGQNYGIGILQ